MYLIRPVREDDLSRLEELAGSIEGGGMTTLPQDRDILERKIRASTTNFANEIVDPGRETYLLVLEDLETGIVGGTAAVFARIGLEKAFYTYSLTKSTHVSVELGRHNTHEVLHLVNDYIGYAEVGSLYVAPDFRKPNVGRILARSRYLLMAEQRERFPESVVAEMRGWQDENGQSPFWEGLGKHFFNMTFHEADHLSAISNNQFIADLMPKYPVYVDLLPASAQAVIGKPHDDTVPALRLLEAEGFRYRRHVDIFDAGPCVDTRIDNIKTIRESLVAKVSKVVKPGERSADTMEDRIIATGRGPAFRTSAGAMRPKGDEIELSEDLAKALSVEPGDVVRHAPMR